MQLRGGSGNVSPMDDAVGQLLARGCVQRVRCNELVATSEMKAEAECLDDLTNDIIGR